MSEERKHIQYTAADLLEPRVNDACLTLWNAATQFVLITWAFEKQIGVATSAIAGAVIAFLLSLPARRKRTRRLPQTELLDMSVQGCTNAFKEATRAALSQEDNDPAENYNWIIDEVDGAANKIALRIEKDGVAGCGFSIGATFDKQEANTRATYEYKWVGESTNRSPGMEREVAYRLGVFRANYEMKTGTSQAYRSWRFTLLRAKLRLLKALNVKRLSIGWAILSLLFFTAILPTIPDDFSTKPWWYVPFVDGEQILIATGVLLYALDVRKPAVTKLWRPLFPLLVLAECTNLVYGYLHIDSYPRLNDSSPIEIVLGIMLVYTVFVVPAFYANYVFAYGQPD